MTLWAFAVAAVLFAAYLITRSFRRGKPRSLGWGLIFLAVFVLLTTIALLRDT